MRFIFIALVGLMISSMSFAGVPPELARLHGKSGSFSLDRFNGRCAITVNRASGRVFVGVSTNVEFGDVSFDAESLRSRGPGIWDTNSTGKRPGSDQCGDFGGMVNYKEIVQVSDHSLVVTQSFRCALEMFKSYQFVRTCSF